MLDLSYRTRNIWQKKISFKYFFGAKKTAILVIAVKNYIFLFLASAQSPQ